MKRVLALGFGFGARTGVGRDTNFRSDPSLIRKNTLKTFAALTFEPAPNPNPDPVPDINSHQVGHAELLGPQGGFAEPPTPTYPNPNPETLNPSPHRQQDQKLADTPWRYYTWSEYLVEAVSFGSKPNPNLL